ncbi:MAG: hypothetical protein L0Z62_28005 [Gemmataceae bacterium]|nr:hypothetical protein [Gemmataceae bacterium]
MNRRFWVILPGLALLGAALALPAPAQGPSRVVRSFRPGATDPAYDTARFLLSPEVVTDEKDKSIRLARSVLVADEMGSTDFHQTEPLGDRTQVKKVFVLDDTQLEDVELFFYGSAKQVRVNGTEVSPPQRLISTGWSRVSIPTDALKKGANEITFTGPGNLLLEPGRAPGRSYKSTDGGKTWTNETLGRKGGDQGEYLIRLRLGRYAARGSAMSQVVDLWATQTGEVGTPGKLVAINSLAALTRGQPAGTRLAVSVRTGSTPTPDAKTWTGWAALDRDYRPEASAQRHRWAQLKFDLSTSKPQATPRVPAFDLAFEFQADPTPPPVQPAHGRGSSQGGKLTVTPAGGRTQAPRIGSTAFVYQEPSPRLKLLRERYKLDEVIAPGKSEMEQLMLLRYWIRNQWHTAWGNHPAQWMPPWDALIILESKDQPDCLTMCTHYAAVFTQCCLALGWNARHCILDHHCVSEVYVNTFDKWVMMDTGNSAQRADVGLHFERGGVPLSALELHLAHRDGKTDGITVHFTPARLAEKIASMCRPAPEAKKKLTPRPDMIPLADLKKFPVCGIENYRRYAFPPRNNFLSSLVPGELYQGWAEYFYDGYCWVGDSPDNPRVSPEYSRALSPSRPQDIDWNLGWCRIHLSRTDKAGEVRVDVETHTPNLARLEKQGAKGEKWQATAATFMWQLQPGRNVLGVRSVNHWGKAGAESRVQVEWTPVGK